MERSFFLALVLLSGCTSHLTDHGKMVKLVRLRGEKREIRVLMSKLRKDECKFIKKINVPYPTKAKRPEQQIEYDLKNSGALAGGNGIMSTLKKIGDPPVVVGLVFICPEGKGLTEDL